VPVRVDYELTDLGRTLVPVMRAVKAWAEEHIEAVEHARSRYDRAVSARAGSG
jgi:DNA-binding HxlR family transcriptional regulator